MTGKVRWTCLVDGVVWIGENNGNCILLVWWLEELSYDGGDGSNTGWGPCERYCCW